MKKPIKIYALLLGTTFGAVVTGSYLLINEPTKEEISESLELTEDEERFVKDYDEVLHGGRPIEPGEFIPSVWIGNCTATVVSQNVIITAAHCKANNSTVSFRLLGKQHSGRCQRHPQYNQGGSLNNDFSLCKFSPNVLLDNYGDLSPITSKVGDIITMQGYGKGSGGKLNWGNGVIARINSQDIITSGRLALGSGDSGGALFSNVKDRKNGPFRIIGINSRGGRGTSLFNITSLPRSQKFFIDWALKNSAEICGVTSDCISMSPPETNLCHAEKGILKDLENDYFFAKAQKDACSGKDSSKIDNALINGKVANPEDWPEVVKIRIGNTSCSATLVAPDVIITAAHCGSHRSRVSFTIQGKQATGTCYRHPSYPRQDVDIMACKLDQSFPDVRFASISTQHAVRDIVTLAGYGCTRPGGGGSDGKLRYGNARILRYSAYDIISSDGAALCYGDSGGPMFQRIVEPSIDPHYLIAVNSKGDIATTSYNTNLALKTSSDFLKNFEAEHNVQICGISRNCLIGSPLDCGVESDILRFIQKQIDHMKEVIAACES